jgi:stage V sporulation protein AF
LGAGVFGSVATKVGIFTPEALVYVTFAAISAFAISNIELGMVTRLVRLSLLILEWAWALPGIILGLFFWFMLALRTESLGVPFLWPVLPFNWISLRSILVREPLTARNPRPIALHPINRYRGGEKV